MQKMGKTQIKNPKNKRVEESKKKVIESALLERVFIIGIVPILFLSKSWTQILLILFIK
jgi:hypothetical protein